MSITTNIHNESLIRGDTFEHRITVKKTDETVKDITGATVRYTIRATSYEGSQVLQKMVGSGVVLTMPTQGILDVTLSASDTAALSPKTVYVYDCEVTISGVVKTVQQGSLTVSGDISQ